MKITDEAVDAVVNDAQKWDPECSPPWWPEGGAHAAVRHMLEIAAPHLDEATQPVVDRDALLQLLDDYAVGRHLPEDVAQQRGFIADAILALIEES